MTVDDWFEDLAVQIRLKPNIVDASLRQPVVWLFLLATEHLTLETSECCIHCWHYSRTCRSVTLTIDDEIQCRIQKAATSFGLLCILWQNKIFSPSSSFAAAFVEASRHNQGR